MKHLHIHLPEWLELFLSENSHAKVFASDREKMEVAIHLSHLNVIHQSGGPFGAAIFDQNTHHLIGAGVNRVVPLKNSTLHAEMVAIMFAENHVNAFSLSQNALSTEIFTSCAPCAMCSWY